MDQIEDIEEFEEQARLIGETLGSATAMADAFDEQMRRMQRTMDETTTGLGKLERGFSGGLRKAFDGLVFDGMKLSDALATVAEAMSRTVYNNAMKPVTDHFGGLLADGVNSLIGTVMPFARGGAFSDGRVMPFAQGGVVRSPTSFPMRGATGLMGEAGPEAIMPLSRGSDGRLGVRAAGGGNVTINMNIQTPDVAGFQRSRGQIAAQLTRMMGQGQRNR